MFFLIDILTFLVQLLKGSLRCPGEDSELWRKLCKGPRDVWALSHQCLWHCLCWCCSRLCLGTLPCTGCQRCGWLYTALCVLWGRPCAVLRCRWTVLHTNTSPFSFYSPSHVGTHTHTHAHSFPAFPHYPSALNCTQIWFWARPQKCNTWHLLLVLALHSQCTGVYATVMSHTSTLNSPSPPFPNKNIDLLLPFVIPPPFWRQ